MSTASVWDIFGTSEGPYRTNISQAQTEDDKVELLAEELRPHFRTWTRPQLSGRLCTGRRVRADLALSPRTPWGGRHGNSYAPFTLEVKFYNEIGATTKAVGQAADYAHAVWDTTRLQTDNWPHLPDDGRMLSCIVWTAGSCHADRGGRMWLDRIAGRLNVMVLEHIPWQGWTITMSGNEQWSERRGMANTAFSARCKDGAR